MNKSAKNIFFISYLVEPNNTVGSQRVSYWSKHWNEHRPNDNVYIVSSMNSDQFKMCEGFNVVPLSKSNAILSKLIKDEGINWRKNLLKFFYQNPIKPDYVIITGSPFMQFGLSKELKKIHPGCKVILDFRDPFAINPRFPKNKIKELIKGYFEQRFCKWSDAIIHVNSYCSKLLVNYANFENKTHVISNGFRDDFSLLNQIIIPADGKVHLVYGGKFYESDIAQKLLQELINRNIVVHHFGETNEHSLKLSKYSNFISHGLVDYNYLMTAIHQSDGGLIITQGQNFESTTKVYDYIANQKPIWILSSKRLTTGALLEEIEDYPAKYAGDASTDSLNQGIEFIHANKLSSYKAIYKFSRKEGLKKLISICESI